MSSGTPRNLRLLKWFNFCLDFRLYDAVAVIYFAEVSGSFSLGLTVFATGTVASALLEVPTGIFSDLVGRKRTLVSGAVCGVIGVACYALADSFWVLAVGAAIEGLAYALYSGNNQALTYDTLKEEGKEGTYAEHEGQLSSMFQIALAISAVLGSIVLGVSSFRWVFGLSVLSQAAGLIFALRIREPKRFADDPETNIFSHLKEALQKFKENYRLRTLSLTQVLDHGIGEAMHQFSPAFLATLWPVWAIGIARVFSHVNAAVGMRLGGKLAKKVGELRLLLGGSAIGTGISIVITAFPTVLTPLINSLTSFFFGTGIVAQRALLQREFTDRQRATMGSLNSLAGSLLFGVLAVALGALADEVGPRWALLAGEVLSVSSILLYAKLFRGQPR